MNEQEMIKRYIYEVIKRVPQETREEIRLELQSLIDDMCSDEDISVEQVLQKLGDPAEFAKRYRDDHNYVIGPEYYDHYIWVLKLALLGIGISAVISAIVSGLDAFSNNASEIDNMVNLFINFFSELFSTGLGGLLSAIGIVTLIFAILERQKVKVSVKPEKNWSVDELSKNTATAKSWTPNSLPPVPDKRAIIHRSDSIVSIVFITIFAALLLFVPQIFGFFHYDGERFTSIACVFNLDEWNRIIPLFLLSLFVGLADQIIRLVTGYYCKIVLYSSIICNAIQIVIAIWLLKFLPFWNPSFESELRSVLDIEVFGNSTVIILPGNNNAIGNIILFIICFASLAEVGVALYKTLRYKELSL